MLAHACTKNIYISDNIYGHKSTAQLTYYEFGWFNFKCAYIYI